MVPDGKGIVGRMQTSEAMGRAIVDGGESFRAVPFTRVRVEDAFWGPRIETNRARTLPHAERLCEETGRFAAYDLVWQPGQPRMPHVFWDSDVAKWVEAVSYSLATHPDAALEARLDGIIARMAAAQQADGYLNPHFTVAEPEKRWTNLRDWHELYCAGHLIEAGVAHFQATGKRTLLDVVRRYADYIATVFGRGPGRKRGYPGHEEIELALVKLFRVTEERRYLDLAAYFVDERGQHSPEMAHYYAVEALARGEEPTAGGAGAYEYFQAHAPVREQTEVAGHAVRAMYLYSAMADLARETGDASLRAACERLWEHVTARRMYVTGGIGTSAANEGFTRDYDLPNETAYAETCAAIGLVFWGQRMLQLELDGRYGDVMERALYNGVLSGVSLDGLRFFYVNPLASEGGHHRKPWYDVSCCPTNIVRLLASLGQYIYGVNGRGDVAVHLYVGSEARLDVRGQAVTLRQETRYPWEGSCRIRMELEGVRTLRFAVRLRVPGWCREARLMVNGAEVALGGCMERGYAVVEREWVSGDVIALDLPMPVERVYANPRVTADVGRVALQRGPVVYAVEGVDVDVATPLDRVVLPREAELVAAFDEGLLGGVTVVRGEALAEEQWDAGMLYRTRPAAGTRRAFTAVPYFAWDNRAAGEMRVWLREG